MISDDRAEKALRYLAETDEPAALAKAECERAEFAYKRTKDAIFTHLDGTVGDRQAQAAQHPKTIEAHDRYVETIRAWAHFQNKRETERIVLDTWRTIQANRRQG